MLYYPFCQIKSLQLSIDPQGIRRIINTEYNWPSDKESIYLKKCGQRIELNDQDITKIKQSATKPPAYLIECMV